MPARHPVHVVYGGAHLFSAETPAKVGALARAAFERYAPDPAAFVEIFGPQPPELHARVRAKLAAEPVEDYRVDFEDGYGFRADAEEDAAAEKVAAELVRAANTNALPPHFGVRVKAFQPETRARAERTLRIVLQAARDLPLDRFVVTLPKVTDPAQVAAFVRVLGEFKGDIRLELMVEHVRAIYAADGTLALPKLVAAAEGRCVAAHFGTYDYTASAGITAAWQRPDHPACDLARGLMQIALADTGVRLSDGATTILPVEPHKSPQDPTQVAANTAAVRHAWRTHHDNVRRSLANGFYQGWDLHPAQLVPRYAATYAFFRESAAPLAARLRNFLDRAAQATRVGAQFDDAATGQGLLETFARGRACGAYTAEDLAAAGLSDADLGVRSFSALVAARLA